MDRRLLDYVPMLEAFGSSEFEREAERAASAEAPPFDDATELTFASELLAIPAEDDFDGFLRRLIASAGNMPPALAAALVALLRRAAQPLMQPLRRTQLAGPDRRGLARAARIFGLELEGLSPEDKEFALARQFVRFAGRAAQRALAWKGPPRAAPAQVLQMAAREYAPGLLAQLASPPRLQGRWVRQGNRVVILDC